MKLATVLALSVTAQQVGDGDRKIGADGDRKVPNRHPLQRLWRLYQFSEEIILLHYYRSPMKESRVDAIRELVKKWLYMGQRESFLRGTRKCGFYDPNEGAHGGPAPIDAEGNAVFDGNTAAGIDSEHEFTGYRIKSKVGDQVPTTIEIFEVRGADHNPRVRRHQVSTFEFEQERVRRDLVADQVQAEIDAFPHQLDGEFDDDMLDEGENGFTLLRLKRDDPCRAIKQVFIGFRKWADRYIANCDGQATHKHMHKRALKFYNEFREVCEDIPRIDISA